ncbi:MAG: ArsR/SmtB family transcription factor [Acidimicrobiales bacterium]
MIDEVEQPGPEELQLPAVLAALADPGRLATVRMLAEAGEACCSKVQEDSGLDCSKSTLSHHLRVLREAGLTHTRVVGARRYVSLRRDDVDARFPGLLDAVLMASSVAGVEPISAP